ncbi:double-stranded RNA-specific editase 1-like [Neocloeon triangulifer]|uniref:double-stranded RNA-specific editase 1-like n=1 Tax=Neocloeon triangulifer TaxID=2078957 RepID=UPI00286F6A4A|nr:double-stranded RNA-specific editase 1-like [Neocloeon triangulifer]
MAYQTRNRGRPTAAQLMMQQQQPATAAPTQLAVQPQIVFSQKEEAPEIDAKMDQDDEYEDLLEPDEPGGVKAKKWMLKKKDPLFKVSKKVRRKRMNARLRRLLQPKNAIMVLNEMSESVKFTFHDPINPASTLFAVTVEVDGHVFTGQGLSKPAAKQAAAENALRNLLMEKMAQSESGAGESEEMNIKEEENKANISDVPPGEEPPLLDQEGRPVNGQPPQPEDDVPWGSLASFALYKLFNEWQSQGVNVNFKPASKPAAGQTETRAAPAPMKKLPDNPTDRHPVMLLNQLRPNAVFEDAGSQGVPPNIMFTVSVTVDSASYQGIGKNKKDAKKEAAKQALATIFDVHYDN